MQGQDIMEGVERQIAAAASEPKPSVGRIVHYRAERGHLIAALITAVISHDEVLLTLFPPNSGPLALGFSTSRGSAPGNWSWPERA